MVPDPKVIRIPLIGLLVERKTDLLAAAAFVMALAAALAQLYHLWVGPRVTLFPPDQAIIILETIRDGRQILRIGARMAYVNTGRPGYNATVRQETVSFTLGGQPYIHMWQSERRFSDLQGHLEKKYVSEARPIPITAGSSVSREIYFAPHPERCRQSQSNCNPDKQYIFKADALRLLSATKTLKLTFTSLLFDDAQPMTASCLVEVTPAVMRGLENEKQGWAAPPCWPEDADTDND